MASVNAVAEDELRVRVTADVAAADAPVGATLTIARVVAGTSVVEPIATWIHTNAAETRIISDAGAPFGIETRWLLLSNGATIATSTTVMLTTAGCWLTTGPYPHQIIPVEVQAWDTQELAPRESEHRVIGRRDVVVLQDVWDLPAGDITFLVRDIAAVQALTNALTAGGTALLRTQPDSLITWTIITDTGVGDGRWWFTVGPITRSRLSGRSPDGRRFVSATTRGSVPPPPVTAVVGSTLAQLAAVGSPLEVLATKGPTLGSLVTLGV